MIDNKFKQLKVMKKFFILATMVALASMSAGAKGVKNVKINDAITFKIDTVKIITPAVDSPIEEKNIEKEIIKLKELILYADFVNKVKIKESKVFAIENKKEGRK